MFKVGDIIECTNGFNYKVLAVCGDVFCLSTRRCTNEVSAWYSFNCAKELRWKHLLPEPPKER